MEIGDVLQVTPVVHPDGRVRRVGFDLTHPYVEQCWGAVVGPSATVLLRRLPALWTERVPATMTHGDLARSLGLGAGAGNNSRLRSTLERVVRFGLAQWDDRGSALGVYLQVPPLRPDQVARLPEWTQRAHEHLFSAHLQTLDVAVTPNPRVAAITARLDRLQQRRGTGPPLALRPEQAVGR